MIQRKLVNSAFKHTKALLLATAICIPFCPTTVFAAIRIWDGGAGTTNWFTATNWNLDFVPSTATSDSAYINNGTVAIASSGAEATVLRLGNTVNTTGSLTVSNNFTTAGASIIAYNTGTNDTMTVTGAGTTWSLTSLDIARAGTGQLTISAGGFVNASSTLTSGTVSTGNGTVLITGTDSRLFSGGGTFSVGDVGTGLLRVESGGRADLLGIRLGNASSANGTLTVTGTGSVVAIQGNYAVGVNGTGQLNVLAGGKITSKTTSSIASQVNGTGSVLVSGANSEWSLLTGNLGIGNLGTGSLTVSDGGKVSIAFGRDINIAGTGAHGTLNIGADALSAAAAPGTIAGDNIDLNFLTGTGTIVFNHTETNYDFAPNIIGTGTINFLAGTTNLTGDLSAFTGTLIGSANVRLSSGETTSITTNSSAFAGTTTVDQNSLLSVNGSLGGTVIVDDTGRLQGNGQLATVNVLSGGTVAPGNSIGTTNVVNTTFNPGSIYEVELNSAGQSDLIAASGTATLNGGTVRVIPFPDTALNTPYTILTAGGGVTGTFDGVEFTRFLSGILDYTTPNTVFLTLNTNNDALMSATETSNQQSVATLAITDSATNAALAALFMLPDNASAREAFDALSGELHASLRNSLIRDQSILRGAAADTPDVELKTERGRMWMQGFGVFGTTDSNNNAASVDRNTKGILIGAEKQYDGWHAGVATGYSDVSVDIDDRGSKGKSNDIHVMAYGGTDRANAANIDGGVSATWHDIDTTRDINFTGFNGTSEADYHAATIQTFAGVHRDLAAGPVTITPFAKGAVILHRTGSFTEDGEAGLKSESDTVVIGQTTLGIGLDRDVHISDHVLNLNTSIGWQHTIGETDPDLRLGFADETSLASIHGAPLDANAVVFEFGSDLQITPTIAFNAGYGGSFSQDNTEHAVKGSLKVAF